MACIDEIVDVNAMQRVEINKCCQTVVVVVVVVVRHSSSSSSFSPQQPLWMIYAHVQYRQNEEYPQVIPVPCGKQPTQTVRWVATAAIARTDKVNLQGWKVLGLPKRVSLESFDGKPLSLASDGAALTQVLENGDHIFVVPERFAP